MLLPVLTMSITWTLESLTMLYVLKEEGLFSKKLGACLLPDSPTAYPVSLLRLFEALAMYF